MDAFKTIRTDPRVDELVRLLTAAKGPVAAEGLWGSCAPILAAIVGERLGRPLLLVTAHTDEADDNRDDIETAIGTAPELLPALETLPGEQVAADELSAERLRLCMALSEGAPGSRPSVIVAPIQALMQTVPSPEAIAAQSRGLQVGATVQPDSLAQWLTERGFTRCDQVELPGDFALRGGILDVFSYAHNDPVRIEFFGDQIESIRLFDATSQRSSHPLQAVRIPSFGAAAVPTRLTPRDATTGFLAYLPTDTIIAFNEPVEIQELGRTYWQRLGEPAGFIPADAVFRRANDYHQLHLIRFAGGGYDRAVQLDVGSLPQFDAKSGDAMAAVRELANEIEVVVLCDTKPEQDHFLELLENPPEQIAVADDSKPEAEGLNPPPVTPQTPPLPTPNSKLQTPNSQLRTPQSLQTTVGVIHRGFRWASTAFIPHHEIFGRYRQRRTLRRVQPARPIDSFFDLNPGDNVVHVMHGIGKFIGLKSLEKDDRREEYLAIEYADAAVVHVPISQIDLVQKYVGSFKRPVLSKIGGTAWKKAKQRVADSVTDMAAELLSVQARRATELGIAYPRDTTWQSEFEGSFIYTETEDQLRALEEIKGDMTRPRPMDRLLCGDVGFGKTELAMRSAFKVVEFGKQVAVLVPTTVLAEQHFMTFKERMADYPFKVEVLSRFRTKGEQTRIIAATRKGEVDILIGTHRLLSKDVRFADLGLVVIDEEQRFGVEAKERLKRLRATVEVMTMTATPIPRTLHMAMLGIKDISSLATPPLDRRAIVTQVRMWDQKLIRDAILRELNRDGQVFFVHNFVRDIQAIAATIQGIVPEARIVVGHGQMHEHEMENVMLKFMKREADVLVSTSIIESGIDIPSANTIFINRAERFGLADLHQLRGRVGRSKHRAYAYLLLSPNHAVNPNAAKRLKAVEHYSHVGAGFQIAMRDLEIRGAGNILGAEQSGHIEAVGYEMYCQLLEQGVKRLKNEPVKSERRVNLELGVTATIPKAYIRAEKQRMEVYKRLANGMTPQDIAVVEQDLRDAFGPPPPAVETLLTLAEIRVLATNWGIRSIVLTAPDLVFSIDDLKQTERLFAAGPGSPRIPDPNTIHWRLPARYLETATLLPILRKQLAGQAAPKPPEPTTKPPPKPAAPRVSTVRPTRR